MGREEQGATPTAGRRQVIPRTLCFVLRGDTVLLLRGAADKRLWAGKYNGLGGHIEPDEDVLASVQREVREEAGLEVTGTRLAAVVHIDAGNPVVGILFFVFTAQAAGEPVEMGAEGSLAWFHRAALPVAEMVEDLPVLLPRVLALSPDDGLLFAHYHYDEENRLVMRFSP